MMRLFRLGIVVSAFLVVLQIIAFHNVAYAADTIYPGSYEYSTNAYIVTGYFVNRATVRVKFWNGGTEDFTARKLTGSGSATFFNSGNCSVPSNTNQFGNMDSILNINYNDWPSGNNQKTFIPKTTPPIATGNVFRQNAADVGGGYIGEPAPGFQQTMQDLMQANSPAGTGGDNANKFGNIDNVDSSNSVLANHNSDDGASIPSYIALWDHPDGTGDTSCSWTVHAIIISNAPSVQAPYSSWSSMFHWQNKDNLQPIFANNEKGLSDVYAYTNDGSDTFSDIKTDGSIDIDTNTGLNRYTIQKKKWNSNTSNVQLPGNGGSTVDSYAAMGDLSACVDNIEAKPLAQTGYFTPIYNHSKDPSLVEPSHYPEFGFHGPWPYGAVGTPDSYRTTYPSTDSAYIGPYPSGAKNPNCDQFTTFSITLTTPDQLPPPRDSGSTGATTCESSDPFGWLTCKVMEGAASAADMVYSQFIIPLLTTSPIPLSPNGNVPDTYSIWSNFRIYGDIFLVIATLVVVFGEAIGGGLIEAYTARKMLPRVLVAAILINLSIYIVAALVDLTNILGTGIFDVLTHATGPLTLVASTTSGIGLVALFGGGVAWLTGGIGVVVMLIIVPAFLALLGVFATILIRTGLILFLVFISPVAFALYALPNTEKYFRKWWESLFTTLMVFPIISTLFAISRILAQTINSGQNPLIAKGGLTDLISMAALILPLFLIPFAFKLAGGAIGGLHAAVSGVSGRGHSMIYGDRKNPASKYNQTLNTARQHRNNFGISKEGAKGLFSRNPRRGFSSAREINRIVLGRQFMEGSPVDQSFKENDKYQLAVANRKEAMRQRNETLREYDADGTTKNKGYSVMAAHTWDQAISAADQIPRTRGNRMVAAQAWAASGYNFDKDPDKAYAQLSSTMADITGVKLTKDANGQIIAHGINAGAYTNAMNKGAINLKNAGMFHLGGVNNGTSNDTELGLSKAEPWTLATRAKPDAITAKGKMIDQRIAAANAAQAAIPTATTAKEAEAYADKYNAEMQAAEIHRLELSTVGDNATGGNQAAALQALKTFSEGSNSTILANWKKIEAPGDRPQVETRVNYTPDKATLWPSADRARGWRTETRPRNLGDDAKSQARGFRQPNPNEIE
jgi:hypothetical protein